MFRRWDPWEELRRMQEWINEMFAEFGMPPYGRRMLPRTGEEGLATVTPSTDVINRESEIVVRADIPGVDKEGISVELKGNTLEINAEKKKEEEEKGEGFIKKERYYSKYYRQIELPTEVDKERIDATFKDGVLEIKLPKKEAAEIKKITVK
ncbi:MAG: Hsp20/alpha crystallin family protein [Candidatus Syntropharchaeia archaeon]